MIWFHTVALPLATAVALLLAVKSRAPLWKPAALLAGCGLMLAGLWGGAGYATALLIAGGVLFAIGVPRRIAK